MGLFSWFGEKLQSGCDWVKGKCESVVNFTKEKIQEVKEKTAIAVERIGEKVERWGTKIKEFVKPKSKKKPYSPEPTDIEAIERAKHTIVEHFPDGIVNTLENLNETQRIDTFQNFVQDAIVDLNLDKTNLDVQIVPPETEEEMSVYGYFSRKDNTLFINAEFIVCDNLELVKEQVFTVYHELMHARQWAAVCAWASTPQGDTFGYSVNRILEYANNYGHYISPRVDRELYRWQPLERDAFGFESKLKEANL